MTDALISIIVPVYNVEKYLPRCLDSLINQSYNDLEIIVIDDGSNDSSSQICEDYSQKDNRISVYHKINGGLSDARNTGIQYVTGEYLTFIDSDDYVQSDYIKTLYENLINYNADISICSFEKLIEGQKPSINIKGRVEILDQDKCMLQILGGKLGLQFTTAWGKIFKRDVFNELRFPKGKVHEDIFLAHYWFSKVKKVVYTSSQFYYYMFREDSITSKERSNTFTNCDIIEAVEERLIFFKSWNNGKYMNKGYVGYITMCLGVYPRLTKNLLIKKIYILKEMKKIYSMSNNEKIKLDTILKYRLYFFVKYPGIYSRIIRLLKMN